MDLSNCFERKVSRLNPGYELIFVLPAYASRALELIRFRLPGSRKSFTDRFRTCTQPEVRSRWSSHNWHAESDASCSSTRTESMAAAVPHNPSVVRVLNPVNQMRFLACTTSAITSTPTHAFLPLISLFWCNRCRSSCLEPKRPKPQPSKRTSRRTPLFGSRRAKQPVPTLPGACQGVQGMAILMTAHLHCASKIQ